MTHFLSPDERNKLTQASRARVVKQTNANNELLGVLIDMILENDYTPGQSVSFRYCDFYSWAVDYYRKRSRKITRHEVEMLLKQLLAQKALSRQGNKRLSESTFVANHNFKMRLMDFWAMAAEKVCLESLDPEELEAIQEEYDIYV